MTALLGHPPQQGAPADQLTTMLARKTRNELYEYLAQFQTLLQQNPQQAREMLVQNPNLARALFQIQIILGMVSNPLGDVAPKGVAPPGILPPRHGEGPPQEAPQQQQYMQPAPQYAPQDPNLGPYSGPSPYPPMQPVHYMPPGEPAPGLGPMMPAAAHAVPVDPRLAASAVPVPMPADPRLAGLPPQQTAMASAPRPMVSVAVGGPPPMVSAVGAGPSAPAPAAAPMTAEQQALLQQLMGLSAAQIELLPPAQKAQVLALQQQMVGRYANELCVPCIFLAFLTNVLATVCRELRGDEAAGDCYKYIVHL